MSWSVSWLEKELDAAHCWLQGAEKHGEVQFEILFHNVSLVLMSE